MGVYAYSIRAKRNKMTVDGETVFVLPYEFAYKLNYRDDEGIHARFYGKTFQGLVDSDLRGAWVCFGEFTDGARVYKAQDDYYAPRMLTEFFSEADLKGPEPVLKFMGEVRRGKKIGRGYRYYLDRNPVMIEKLSQPM